MFCAFSVLFAIILILFALSTLLQNFSIATIKVLARYEMLCKFKLFTTVIPTCLVLVLAKFFVDIDYNVEGSHSFHQYSWFTTNEFTC